MEFIDCDVSQFSTSRPTLTQTQPNPLYLRNRKSWDEYCHKVQRYCASEPQNQPQSVLSARMDTTITLSSTPTALAASAPNDLEATIRNIIAETKPTPDTKRVFAYPERDSFIEERRGNRQHREDQRSSRQQLRHQTTQRLQDYQRPPSYQQRPAYQPQRPKNPQDPYRYPPYLPFPSNAERHPHHGNKRASDAMEHRDRENDQEEACEDQAAYGAHHLYGLDGNYDDSYYAMSAAAEYDDNHGEFENEDEETYAS